MALSLKWHTWEESVALSALINRLRTPKLKFQLIESQVSTYVETMKQCQSLVTASYICRTHDSKKQKHDERDRGSINQKPTKTTNIHHGGKKVIYRIISVLLPRWGNLDPDKSTPRKKDPVRGTYRIRIMIPGSIETKDIFYAIRVEIVISPPTTTSYDRRNYNFWCDYHKEHGHTLSQYREVKRI